MKFFRTHLFLLAVFLIPLSIYGQGFGSGETRAVSESAFKLLSHVDLNITRIKNVNEAGLGFHGGAIGVCKFSPFIGVHLGAQYNQIAASENGVDVKAAYIDIPLGLTISYVNGFQGSTSFINIGGFFGVPVSDFKSSGATEEQLDLEEMIGVNFDTHSVWPVNEKLKIGLHTFLKFGLKSMIELENTDANYYAVGFGVSAVFL